MEHTKFPRRIGEKFPGCAAAPAECIDLLGACIEVQQVEKLRGLSQTCVVETSVSALLERDFSLNLAYHSVNLGVIIRNAEVIRYRKLDGPVFV